jgi:hypothetical protein
VLTADELATKLGRTPGQIEALLAESLVENVLEECEGGYRLTEDAERELGAALRDLEMS